MSPKYLKQSIITLLSLGLIFLANSVLWAWTAPTANPPSGNISAPVNVSSVAQDKAGDLAIGSGLNYWITKYFDSFALKNNANQIKFVLGQDGHVGIGTDAPAAELEVKGNIKVSESNPVWTDLGDQGNSINSMAVYNYKLYIGQINGYVKSYNGSAWTDLGDRGAWVGSMAVYNNKLYIGQGDGFVQFYDGSAWTNLGDQGDSIYSVTVYNDKLYIGQGDGYVKELSYNGMINISNDTVATKGYVDNLPSVVTGEYTGNGAGNRLIYLGFSPSLVLVGDTGGINTHQARVTYIFGYRGSCGMAAWDTTGHGVWFCSTADDACALDPDGFRTSNTSLMTANAAGRPYRYMAWR